MIQVDILSPDGEIYSGKTDKITIPGEDGKFQVLKDHAPMISTIGKGVIQFGDENESTTFEVEGGILEILNNKIIILVERIFKEETEQD